MRWPAVSLDFLRLQRQRRLASSPPGSWPGDSCYVAMGISWGYDPNLSNCSMFSHPSCRQLWVATGNSSYGLWLSAVWSFIGGGWRWSVLVAFWPLTAVQIKRWKTWIPSWYGSRIQRWCLKKFKQNSHLPRYTAQGRVPQQHELTGKPQGGVAGNIEHMMGDNGGLRYVMCGKYVCI